MRSIRIAVVLALAACTVSNTPAFATSEPSCVLVEQDRRDRKWLRTQGAQAAVQAVEELLAARYQAPKEHYHDRIRRGLLGTATDYAAHDIVIVVDPVLVDMGGLQSELQSVVAKALPSDDSSDLGVRVHAGCHGGPELYEVHEFLLTKFGYLTLSTYSWGLDVGRARWNICNQNAVANALLEVWYRELVHIEQGCVPLEPV